MSIHKIDKLIIGLGNHDVKYSQTRHNIGYDVVRNFANKFNAKWQKIDNIASFAIIDVLSQTILAVLPLTYMNNSGIAASFFLEKYNIPTSDMLVVVDEYNFPLGKIHLKKINSAGGHNGIASIIQHTFYNKDAIDSLAVDTSYENELISNNNAMILRCGIDKKFGPNELSAYVLSEFDFNEISAKNQMIIEACRAIEFFLDNDIGKAMSYMNSGRMK